MICGKCKTQIMYLNRKLYCMCKKSPKKASEDVIDCYESK